MNSTTEQNRAHRTDVVWQKSNGRRFTVAGELYLAEYCNVFTGEAIRKDWRMTGHDWLTFDADGNITGRYATLTIAKEMI